MFYASKYLITRINRSYVLKSITTIRKVLYPSGSQNAVQYAASALCAATGAIASTSSAPEADAFNIGLAQGSWNLKPAEAKPKTDKWIWLIINDNGTGAIVASHAYLLIQGVTLVRDGLLTDMQASSLGNGILIEPAFDVNRAHFDFTLTQTYRHIRDLDPEQHIRTMAENGFTHIEVNGLATFIPFEPGVPNEYYNQFYSYCAALSQFVNSDISNDFYPPEYLSANLNRLKKLAAIGRDYGLKPGHRG